MLANYTEKEKMGSSILKWVQKFIYPRSLSKDSNQNLPDMILIYPRPGEMCVVVNGKFYSIPYDQVQFQKLAYNILAASLEGAMHNKKPSE
ncbi:MAG: hypothetical protein CMB77_02295 [Euryarchaeota archaeon]|nr:hypothetical protein [Euryarchaeota archaeon]